MREYLSERETVSGNVRPGESLELPFTPCNRGWVVVVAEAPWRDVEPVKRRVEIGPAGAVEPATVRTDDGLGVATMLTHHLDQEAVSENPTWVARVTNLDESPNEFTLRVLYPGRREIREQAISSSLLEGVLNKLIGGTRIQITRGENRSFVKLPDAMGIPNVRFTVPDFEKKVMFFNLREYPGMITSDELTMSLINASNKYPNGGLGATITFAGEGREILGTFHGKLTEVRLVLQLGLTMDEGTVTYNRVKVDFEFDLDVVGIPDWLFDPVFHYTDQLRRAVEENLSRLLEKDDTRAAFSRGITEHLRSALPEGSTLHSVRVTDNELVLKHYN